MSAAVKCVVWDLDHTLWDGVLLEDPEVRLRPGAVQAVRTLDERGILQSIASRNDREAALARLTELGLAEYFLYPQIHWNSKASSIEAIAKALNILIDSLALVDDDPFERGQVQHAHPSVACFDASDLSALVSLPELTPAHITADARSRRFMMLGDLQRNRAEAAFDGSQHEFLATLGMLLAIAPAQIEDLDRAGELMVRTHQLNTTGYAYSRDELAALLSSSAHLVLMASLEDRYGSYGKIGLALVETACDVWTIKLLLMSCRVASRGVGSLLLNHIRHLARERRVRLVAEFVPNDRNRQMYITFRFAGFKEIPSPGSAAVLLEDFEPQVPPFPAYVTIVAHS